MGLTIRVQRASALSGCDVRWWDPVRRPPEVRARRARGQACIVRGALSAGLAARPPGTLQLTLEGPIEDRGQERVEFGPGLRLERLQPVDLGLQAVQKGDDATLFLRRWYGYSEG